MPAILVKDGDVPGLAEQVSPAMRRVLQVLRVHGVIQNGPGMDQATVEVLNRLAELGLVDPRFSGTGDGEPFVWVSNSNGERVLKHLEKAGRAGPQLDIHPRAETALATLSEAERVRVLVAVEALLGRDPASWPRGEAARLDPGGAVYLVRVSPELRAFVRSVQGGAVELLDIVREDTLRQFLERYRLGSKAG